MNNWYKTLNRPPLTPPDWIFGPVWTILYIMIALALLLFYKNRKNSSSNSSLCALIVFHLVTNFSWTGLFFGLKAPGLALLDIILLDTSLGVIICSFWKKHRTSAILLIPYLIWVLFATYLNAGFYWLNK
jgi:tryptophan-rich sensory protein